MTTTHLLCGDKEVIVTVQTLKELNGKRVRIKGICDDTDWKGYNDTLKVHHHIGKTGIITDHVLFDDGTSTQYYWGLIVEIL